MRSLEFHQLMRHRIRDILVVASKYDAFLLSEEGGFYEMLVREYAGLNLSHAPGITPVSSASEAFDLATRFSYDLVLVTPHIADMHALDFACGLRDRGIKAPIVYLAFDNHQLRGLTGQSEMSCFNKVFLWQGDFHLILAIIKCIEDLQNVAADTELAGVQSVILVEDNVKFYSTYLPLIYTELVRHVQKVMEQGINVTHKILRMRARPKILLTHNYDDAWALFERYHETILGVISDVIYPRNGKLDPMAGIDLARRVKESHTDISVLLQSDNPEHARAVHELGAQLILKHSPLLLNDLRNFLRQYLSFGDFVFALPDGTEVARAHDLSELESRLQTIPAESLEYHAERNHFSNWLKARTEFDLAHRLRPQRVSHYESIEALRTALIATLKAYDAAQRRGTVADFDPVSFDRFDSLYRLGGGSIGGKGRGLVFIERLLGGSGLKERYPGIEISVPSAIFVETDVFDEFIESNGLGEFALECDDNAEILRRFLDAAMPPRATELLRQMLRRTHYPLAVRSSSILEDSLYQPFAGVYDTFMVPNNHHDLDVRLEELLTAIKSVYASTFSVQAKSYIQNTAYSLEEEKMAVIIQRMVGQTHENYFYPDFSGVGQSHNFYPYPPVESEDGLAAVVLGLGAMVVEGGSAVRFCPKYPRHGIRFGSVEEALSHSQHEFYALQLPDADRAIDPHREFLLTRLGLDAAERHGVLGPFGSVCSIENSAIYDGISRKGARIVTFSPILKGGIFPLAELLRDLLELCHTGMGLPVEIEFSANITGSGPRQQRFQVLQLRPMVLSHERQELQIDLSDRTNMIAASTRVLGNGIIEEIFDVVLVDPTRFDRSKSAEVAREISLYNLELANAERPYLLIGIGRWGSADPWLGIPVTWDEIAGAKVIVETGFRDMKVTPSQGTHFFQNLHMYEVGYFTINAGRDSELLDWDWLLAQEPRSTRTYTRALRFDHPLLVKMSGHSGEGVILRPDHK